VSDNWVVFVPEDPLYIPTDAAIAAAVATASRLFPAADKIEPDLSNGIQFFDAGGNWETTYCPGCGQHLSVQWWQDAFGRDHTESGFKLALYPTPCCGAAYTLNDLKYVWPQALGKFGLSAMNPNVGEIAAEACRKLESALGTRLRVIYQHL